MVRWRNFKWLVLLVAGLLAGVIGCSNSNLPRVGEVPVRTTASAPGSVPQPSEDSEMATLCRKFDSSLSGLPEVRISEYHLLQERILQASPLVGQNRELLQRAHVRALSESNQAVINLLHRSMYDLQNDLDTRRLSRKIGAHFVRAINDRRLLDPDQPKGEDDLRTVLGTILQVAEGTPCANGYLSHFYAVYLRELDPFSQLTFGMTEPSAQEDTRGLSVQMPESMGAVPFFEERDHGQPGLLAMHSWDQQEIQGTLDAVLGRLEAATPRLPGLVIDLRYAGGADQAVLEKLRASAARGWGRLPITLWLNYETHGLADVFAYELSTRPNTQLFGPDSETYGYARKLKSDSAILIDGLAPVHFRIGYALVDPASSQGHDGYRVRVPTANVHPEAGLVELLESAMAWDHHISENPVAAEPTAPQDVAPAQFQQPEQQPEKVADQLPPTSPGIPIQMPPQAQVPVEAPVPMAVYSTIPVEENAAEQPSQDTALVEPQVQPENVPPPPAEIPPSPYAQPAQPGQPAQPLQREFEHPGAAAAAAMDPDAWQQPNS